jgi:hypothetical protein
MPLAAYRYVYILRVDQEYRKVNRLSGHSSTVRSLDWGAESRFVMSMDQAYETIVFDAIKGCVSKESHRDQEWRTWTNVLGFPCMGIWPNYSDGTDINAVDRSPSGDFLLACDDFGKARSGHQAIMCKKFTCIRSLC